MAGSALASFKEAEEALRPDHALQHARLREGAGLLAAGRPKLAAKILREYLNDRPNDAAALRLLAETLLRQGHVAEAESQLERCVALAPEFLSSRYCYADTLLKAHKREAAMAEIAVLLAREPRNPMFRMLKATALESREDYAGSCAVWRELVEDYPDRPNCWMRYGHALRGMGARDACIAAYRAVIALDPLFGGSYWSLADLKDFRFSESDIVQMETVLARTDLSTEDRSLLHFALGKAYSDIAEYEKSISSYAKGNALRRLGIKYNPDSFTQYVARCKRVFTRDFFHHRQGFGCVRGDPIFLVGMTRSGSTLVEQILASHAQIEGTRELSELASITRRLQPEMASAEDYPAILEKLEPAQSEALGELYLESVRPHRKFDRPHFTDKMGSNYAHIGLIHLVLPNARIVDIRRHPMACGFSNFTQCYAHGQHFSFRLSEMGRIYRDYVDLMAHFDRVLPGKVYRVFYENLVDDPEAEIRRLLEFLRLPFEAACLQFHNTQRVVATSSSEQVRQPIYRQSMETWRNFEPWLEPLRTALGSVLDAYPDVPEFE
jgi:tetratricopeptide (TPR) repeat protein